MVVTEAPRRIVWRTDRDRQQSIVQARNQSKQDVQLLAEARGKVGNKGQKMSKEQYSALRRKVGGTARDYFKDWVDVCILPRD